MRQGWREGHVWSIIQDMSEKEVSRLEADFGLCVRRVRIANGVSQEELARKANVSRTAVGNLETGAGSTLATVVKVLRALDRSDWLLTLTAPAETFNPLDLLGGHLGGRPKGPPRVKRSRGAPVEGEAGGV